MSSRKTVARLIVSLIKAIAQFYDPQIERDVKEIYKIDSEKPISY